MSKIEEYSVSDERICDYFRSMHLQQVPENLQRLFDIAMKEKSLFPKIKLTANSTYRDFIDKWVQSYLNAENNSVGSRDATPKGTCNDPVVKNIVKMVTRVSDEEATIQEAHHNLFMSAENIQGALLEEYIDSVISQYGWIWCKGNAFHAVDFCTSDGKYLLQIKNKSNSENSSSSKIRSGTNIEKWYRLGTRTVAGKKVPVYKWDILNDIIRYTSGKSCNLSEEDYVRYVEVIAINNPHLITSQ